MRSALLAIIVYALLAGLRLLANPKVVGCSCGEETLAFNLTLRDRASNSVLRGVSVHYCDSACKLSSEDSGSFDGPNHSILRKESIGRTNDQGVVRIEGIFEVSAPVFADGRRGASSIYSSGDILYRFDEGAWIRLKFSSLSGFDSVLNHQSTDCTLVVEKSRGEERASLLESTSTKKTSEPNTKLELELIAKVFEAAAYALSQEPDSKESLGNFLRRGQGTGKVRTERLHFNSNGDVTLSDGRLVSVKSEFGSCMLFENGSETTSIHTFTAEGYKESVQTKLTWTFGNPFPVEGDKK